MAISRKQKEQLVEKLEGLSKRSVAVVVAENQGVEATDMMRLRQKAREQKVELVVAKNTLSRKVFSQSDAYSVLCDDLKNPVLLGFSFEDLSSGAKLLSEFSKSNEALVIKSAAIEGVRYGAENIDYVMSLPTRDEAIAMIARGIQAPTVQLAMALKDVYGQVARVLHAVSEQKGS
jgi:large subunit ribosomal protein L10